MPFALTKFKKIMSEIDDCFEGSNGADASDLLRYIFSSLSSEQTRCIGSNISQMSSFNINTNNEKKCFEECKNRIGDNTALNFITNYIKTKYNCCDKKILNKYKYSYTNHKSFYEFENQSIIEVNYKEAFILKNFFNNFNYKEYKSIDFCPECDNDVNCISKKSLYMTSDYLIINIDYGKNNKINKKFQLEEFLKIKVDTSNRYEIFKLLGVVCHNGNSSSFGHYFAFCRDGDKYFFLNDIQVEVVNLTYIINTVNKKENKPYILFYEKK
jgi:hypothetical protein